MSTVIQATEANVPAAVVQGPPTHSIAEATQVAAMTSAFVSNTYAIQQELATQLSVYHVAGNVGRQPKQQLMRIYGLAGWASEISGADYKTCSRRVNVGALLYTHLGKDLIESWCAGKMEMQLISSIVDGLAPYAIKTIDGCLNFVGKPRVAKKVETPTPSAAPTEKAPLVKVPEVVVPPHEVVDEATITAEPPQSDEQQYEEWLMHRGETPLLNAQLMKDGFRHIETEFVSVNISIHATKDSLLEMAMKLMSLAAELDHEPIEPNVQPGASAESLAVGDIPKSLRKVTEERLVDAPDTPLKLALEAALAELAKEPHEPEEDPETIKAHQAAEAASLAEKKAEPSPSTRYRKPSKPPQTKQ